MEAGSLATAKRLGVALLAIKHFVRPGGLGLLNCSG